MLKCRSWSNIQAGRRCLHFKISPLISTVYLFKFERREMKLSEIPTRSGHGGGCDSELVASKRELNNNKPQFRPAIDDTKPLLQDPILRSDPIETEEAVLRLPPFPPSTSSSQ
ncbi:hypothetical protein L2E82_05046 [Cichorium intybus]|uniref:Uncharacterized protein n=2 Tax=Cichorium intybus TaxID=13427 RepID=A0ACB9H8N0_CICIN|nr:hypothetical protein L2E82_05046 [Cichorium intybus]